MLTVAALKEILDHASGPELEALIACHASDERSSVQAALGSARRRLARERAEDERLGRLYGFEASLVRSQGGGVAVGVDEVGRGPLAGPLAAGAVVLDPAAAPVRGLDDSKKLTPAKREEVAREVRASCRAYAVAYVQPEEIDAQGMAASLRQAFRDAVAAIEAQGAHVDVILLDGNPVGFDEREVSVVKGDGRCASIAAASIIAKVARDRLMEGLDAEHPGYGFAANKGYGSAEHIHALRALGPSTAHRATFCTKILSAPSS